MPSRRRPQVTITLDPHIIDYVNEYARAHGGLTISRAVEALIKEHAEAAGTDGDDRPRVNGRDDPRRRTRPGRARPQSPDLGTAGKKRRLSESSHAASVVWETAQHRSGRVTGRPPPSGGQGGDLPPVW